MSRIFRDKQLNNSEMTEKERIQQKKVLENRIGQLMVLEKNWYIMEKINQAQSEITQFIICYPLQHTELKSILATHVDSKIRNYVAEYP